ncbi:urea amidolyase family protein [Micrococcus terreus]|uniref:5-oxoprolinase subunit B/C family protein n=1 Tax=Micrococcus terreus TaxID=574650 RepID=UPI00254C36CF|nr:urea amidolyase family protein [Micrococcus terreus]MDK7701648.1 urea amidolyase family protein [Micrococcus terreus]WOO96665.1 urea amidolyase family protein [Micrococcus terreus]
MSGPEPRSVRWAGTRALLVECADLPDVLALHAHLAAHPLRGQLEATGAAGTVLVTFESVERARAAVGTLRELTPDAARDQDARAVEIPVVYDGEDLAELTHLTGRSGEELIAAHSGTIWRAAFGGFAPGFAYLTPEPGSPWEGIDVPRRSSPRTAVPAGSVAVAGGFSAVYPSRSPGGWQLIGHTDAVLWDLHRDPPALIRPGDLVRYTAVRERVEISSPPQTPHVPTTAASPGAWAAGALVVEDPGLQSLVQDRGRSGLADLGVGASGAADSRSAALANRLVGNPSGPALIECTLGGLQVQAVGEQIVALTGAPAAATVVSAEESPDQWAPHGEPFVLADGQRLVLEVPAAGLRTYLAVRGGVEAAPVLGSRSTDVLSGIGPSPLRRGTRLPVGTLGEGAAVGHPEPMPDLPAAGEITELRVVLGPREDWFTERSREAFVGQEWEVSSASNRVGVRLIPVEGGTVLERSRGGELASEGMVLGALQVPPSGEPVLFLADHPVTGGYPVIAVVVPEDLPLAAQLPPGARVRFTLHH